MRAQTVGENAMISIDINRPIVRSDDESLVSSPDAALTHELVHAVNINSGNLRLHRAFPPGGAHRYGAPSEEERSAVLIDNMYRSAAGMWLRTRHVEDRMLRPGTELRSEVTGTALSENERRVTSNGHRRVGHLARRLQALSERECPYNPFRQWASLSPAARS